MDLELEQTQDRLEKALLENAKLKMGYQAYETLERERDRLAYRVVELQDALASVTQEDHEAAWGQVRERPAKKRPRSRPDERGLRTEDPDGVARAEASTETSADARGIADAAQRDLLRWLQRETSSLIADTEDRTTKASDAGPRERETVVHLRGQYAAVSSLATHVDNWLTARPSEWPWRIQER